MLTTAAALASSPPPLPGFLNALASPLRHYGLWAIGLLILLEDFGIPVPGETILIAGAIYAGAGRLNVVAVGVVAFFAAVIGDNIGFAIGHFGGRALGPAVGQVRVPDRGAAGQGPGLLRPARRHHHHGRALRRGPAAGERDRSPASAA